MDKTLGAEIESGLIAIGRQIMAWRDDAASKSVRDPKAFKTVADIRAHELIVKLIRRHDANAVVVSEEDAERSAERPDAYWLIDPIDGTASWYSGFDGFVTQLAYVVCGVVQYGAIYAPVLQKLWSASVSEGAWLNGAALPSLVRGKRLNLIDNYPEPRKAAAIVSDKLEITSYIECGSLGLKSALVADGTADLFVKDVVVRDWDLAPVSVILREVGGVMCDLENAPIEFSDSYEKNGGLIVACDEPLAVEAASVIARHQTDMSSTQWG